MNISVVSTFLDIMSDAAINIYLQVFVGACAFASLRLIPRWGISGSYSTLYICFPKWTNYFYIPMNSVCGFWFPQILANAWIHLTFFSFVWG
jgi:hypothetical protein